MGKKIKCQKHPIKVNCEKMPSLLNSRHQSINSPFLHTSKIVSHVNCKPNSQNTFQICGNTALPLNAWGFSPSVFWCSGWLPPSLVQLPLVSLQCLVQHLLTSPLFCLPIVDILYTDNHSIYVKCSIYFHSGQEWVKEAQGSTFCFSKLPKSSNNISYHQRL